MSKGQKERTEKRIADRITKKKIVNGKTYYYVTWKGMSQENGTWLHVHSLSRAFKLIRQYEKEQKLQRKLKNQSKTVSRVQINFEQQKCDRVAITVKSKQQLKQTDIAATVNCFSLISSDQQEVQEPKRVILTPRFDCQQGIWKNVEYTEDELAEIQQQRLRYAWRHDTQGVQINQIVKVKDRPIVQYQRTNQKHQCFLQSFKTYMPQVFIRFLLKNYDPIWEAVRKPQRPKKLQKKAHNL